MKKLTILLTIFMLWSYATIVSAQSLIPDFKNQPYAINGGDHLLKLEKQTVEMKTKAKGMGYGGVSSYINLIPNASPVVLDGSNVNFVIKTDDDVDPETLFYITKCKTNNKSRQVEMQRTSAFAAYGAGGKSTKKDQVSYEIEKIQDNVYKIVIGNLEAGEYAFINTAQGASGSSSIVYAFGIK
ncbi:MAG: hypothetical protein M9887_12355 [Chitinophagales bacterium]|nr:hypothetical protein [Chitinophagales bacterium]